MIPGVKDIKHQTLLPEEAVVCSDIHITSVLNEGCYVFPSQPIGINAAAMLVTPLSVASRLN